MLKVMSLGLLICLGVTACTSVANLGNGRYAVPTAAEVRSPFGSNIAFGKLENCLGVQESPGATMVYTDCHTIRDWSEALATQGQGGQILGGAAAGTGAAVGGMMVDTGANVGQNVLQNVTQSVVTSGKGGHH